jgi:molybdopterin converting factor small subunit
MRITLKLFASLQDFLPKGAIDNAVQVEMPEPASANAVIDRYRIPRELAHLVLVNGIYSARGDRDAATLKPGDTVAIWPPVAGG